MSCGFPGCKKEAEGLPVRVKATPATDFEPGARAVALVDLCAQHRAEFERLGWLELPDDEDGDAGAAE